MNTDMMQQLFSTILRTKGEADITVSGISMEPTLYAGDVITVHQCEQYEIGDILVFTYKIGELLVHRLLRQEDRYYCKGDNAFRLEDISSDQIYGKVTAVNGKPIAPWPEWKIRLSYLVNREFFRCRYQIDKTKASALYALYQNLILKNGGNTMLYKKNEKLDYIQADETSLAVFDPETGDTHFFDETGIDILNILSTPCTLEALLDKLCAIYEAEPADIRPDVEAFLADTVVKKVVELV